MRQDFDAILIGGGHNGLTAAAYLGKFGGLKVLVLEAREILGGFATSEKPFALRPEVTINRFGVDHMHMCGGPVPRKLELETFEPRLWCVAATELDRSLAPEGYHTLWLSQFAPKVLAGGQSWSEIGEAVALSAFHTYAAQSGLREDDIVDIVVTTPDDMARLVHSVDPFGVGMDSNQMLSFRPAPSLSQYRTPIRRLFLTGSGTHPGGGIT